MLHIGNTSSTNPSITQFLTSFYVNPIKVYSKSSHLWINSHENERTKSFNNQSATKNLIPDAILAVFELGASYLHQGDFLTFCGSLRSQTGAAVTPQVYPQGPQVYYQILLNFAPKVYYWISLKDLESDLEYSTFGPLLSRCLAIA